MSVEPFKMMIMKKILSQDLRKKDASPEEKRKAQLEVLEDLKYFVEDPKEFVEVKKQDPGIMIHYPSLNEEGWNKVRDLVGTIKFNRLGKKFMMIAYDDGTIFFPNIASNNFTMDQFRKALKEALDFATQKTLSDMSEKAKEVGAKVLEIPEMRREIAKFLPEKEKEEVEDLLGERERKAESAVKLERARREAMKNKELERFTQNMIDTEGLACLFDDEACYKINEGQPETDYMGYLYSAEINIVPGYAYTYYDDPDNMGAVVFSSEENYWTGDNGEIVDLEKAFTPFEHNIPLTFFNTKVTRREAMDIPEISDRLVDYEENTEEKFRVYWIQVGGYHGKAPFADKDDDRKFYLTYLKKKFNITEDDINKMIEKRKAEIAESKASAMAERKKKEEKKKAKTKEREAKQEVKATEKGLPKGKANAIVLTWREIKEKFPQIKRTEKYDDDKKFKVWLARTNYHMEAVKD